MILIYMMLPNDPPLIFNAVCKDRVSQRASSNVTLCSVHPDWIFAWDSQTSIGSQE